MELIIASQNANKLEEIRQKLPMHDIQGLSETLFAEELREDGDNLEDNALQKARQVYALTAKNCFADDTGLEIAALDNAPGVFSARYAGPQKNSEDNMDLVLFNLRNASDRSARFRTVIALILDGREYLFEGICRGRISEERMGDQGFGYDPIFVPEGETMSFAQMSMEAKNAISHRGRAIDELVRFLQGYEDC